MGRLQSIGSKVKPLSLAKVTGVEPVTTWGKEMGGRPWRRLVEAVKLRDKYVCQGCGRVTDQGECDHIVPISQGGTDDMRNLQWLCTDPCHRNKTALEAKAGADRVGGRSRNPHR